MEALRVRKNFVLDRGVVEKVEAVLKQKRKSFTEVISLYFQAVAKEPKLLEDVEKIATKRSGSFIGKLDGKIGDEEYKSMRRVKNEDFS